mmetsp:Transcript_13978/g.21318  ORF Transcript_13978/g.21318 Transcript_13978/m.21318 type:complete len:149 (+) Transcript_13978:1008-1454(+)|eukprot:CAMPEP_0178926152 /NCGR_PEP_ID=MMETSP0786-20121207/18348_1 /TAXON_ID=186022 /ORGANISM="Thalassionema frauenfeldii, Strain CCMP 1798" /LENGTH=148 /DNA_ID=CAMNT_0020601191 /DNA_START=994 /DNA_END=1440 /DNA_ORIENTATION=-
MKNANGRNKKIPGKKFPKKENLPNNAKTLQKKKVKPIKKHRTGKMKNSSEMRKTKAKNIDKRHTKSLDKAAPKRYPKSHDKNQVKNEQKKGQNLRGEERAYQQKTSKATTGDKPPKSNGKHRKSEAKQKRGQKMLTEEQAYQKQVHMF